MRSSFAIFGTDSVNRQGSRIPCNVLASGLEKHLIGSIQAGFPPGTPMHAAHDMHRPIGWADSTGLFLTGNAVAHVGFLLEPQTEGEIEDIRRDQRAYMDWTIQQGSETSRTLLAGILAPTYVDADNLMFCDAAVLFREGIASDLYPQLFDEESELVDKDGLTSYRGILQQMEYFQPGVFRDRGRGLLIFAHRYFRRSLSSRNQLNDYFLRDFAKSAEGNPDLDYRLRLDPDMIAHEKTYKQRIELEFWHGPKFDDDVSKIKSGVSVHKLTDGTGELEGIDETHFWWKEPEDRAGGAGRTDRIRTLEVEELVSVPSYGLAEDAFGCRYIHAEYDLGRAAITHFDGAIRAYRGDAYDSRRQAQFNRAGKHAEYTKLFRIDRSLDVESWKGLVHAFYRGNGLISEYFNAAPPPIETAAPPAGQTPVDEACPLALLISYRKLPHRDPEAQLCIDRHVDCDGKRIPCIESKDNSAITRYFQTKFASQDIPSLACPDTIFNLPRIVLPVASSKTDLNAYVADLLVAIQEDGKSGVVSSLSTAFAWGWKDLLITVAAAGSCDGVHAMLSELSNIVEPQQPPSEWIVALQRAFNAIAGDGRCFDFASDIVRKAGVLILPHMADPKSGEFTAWLRMPDAS